MPALGLEVVHAYKIDTVHAAFATQSRSRRIQRVGLAAVTITLTKSVYGPNLWEYSRRYVKSFLADDRQVVDLSKYAQYGDSILLGVSVCANPESWIFYRSTLEPDELAKARARAAIDLKLSFTEN
jgi:hypothetical protein